MALLVVLIVATTYWQTWARPALAERQDNAIQRVAQFEIKRGPILSPSRVLARNKEKRVGGRTFYFRRYPQGRLAAHVVGYSDRRALAHRAGAVAEPDPDRFGAQPLVAREPVARQAQRQADHGRHRRDDARRQRPEDRARGARQQLRRGRRPRPAHRPGARDGVLAELQPERRRERLPADRGDQSRLHARLAAPQPGQPGPLPAGLDVQGRDRLGRARLGQVHAVLLLLRPGLLHGVRQAGEQLRHRAPVRQRHARHGAAVLGQLGLLQHRAQARARSRSSSRRRRSDSTSGRHSRRPTASGCRAASTRTAGSTSRGATATSTPAGWRSVRSGCS